MGYFRDPTVAFVGSPQIYSNQEESWIARGSAEQAFTFYGPMQMGLFGLGVQLLIGANHVIRTTALNDIGGYAGHIVEDHLTGMRLYSKKWRSVYVPEVLCVGEGPATWDRYLGQQMRWAWGLIDILLFHTPRLLSKLDIRQKIAYVCLQRFYLFGISQLTGLVLTWLYLLVGWQATQMEILEWVSHSLPAFLFSTAIYYWIQKYYIRPNEERGSQFKGALLMIGAWPIFVLAFLGVIIRRQITYFVTPKGNLASFRSSPGQLTAHMLLATVSIGCLAMAVFATGNLAPTLVFWAVFTATVMNGLVLTTFPRTVARFVWKTSQMGLAYAGIATVVLVVFAVNPLRPLGEPVQAHEKPTPVEVAAEGPNVALAVSLSVPSPTASQPMPTELPKPTLIPSPTVAVPKVVTANFLAQGFKGVAIGAWDPNNQLGSLPKIRSTYTDWNISHWPDVEKELKIAYQNDQVLMITWEPWFWRKEGNLGIPPSEIISGRYDGYIDEWAKRLAAYKQPIILRFAQEAELTGLHPWATTVEEYVRLWRHVIPRVKSKAPNVFTLWSPAGHKQASWYYPGGEYVDFVGATLLSARIWDEVWMGPGKYREFGELLDGTKSLKEFGKPMIMPEVAVSVGDEAKENQWLKAMFAEIKNHPEVIALVYYDAKHPAVDYNIDWRLSQKNLKDFKAVVTSDNYFEINKEVNKN